MSALPPDAPAWAWPLRPFGTNSAMDCHDATARRPYPADGNIRLSSDVALTPTARLEAGRPFGVMTHNANSNQVKFGVGRHYYLPTAEDVARVQRLCPDLLDPENPNWLAIGNKLRGNGHVHLAKLTPPELLALLDANETPPVAVPAPPNAAPPSTGAPPPPFASPPPAGGKTSEEGKKVRGRNRIPKAETESRIRDWLTKHAKENPASITRDAVAAGTGLSAGKVSNSDAWKAFRDRRDAEAKPAARNVPLSATMQAAIPADCPRPDELAALIEEQKAEEAEESRRHKRRHSPS